MIDLLRRSKAFTLVELLVTVAVLGILASMAVMQFAEYRAKANDTLAVAQLRDMYTAIHGSDISLNMLSSSSVAGVDISINNKGVVTLYGNPAVSLATVAPGFNHKLGVDVRIAVGFNSVILHTAHCQGSILLESYEGGTIRRAFYRGYSGEMENYTLLCDTDGVARSWGAIN